MPLINCEINLILTQYENCILTSKATRNAASAQGENPAVSKINNPTNPIIEITKAKLYVPVDTLSTENDKKALRTTKNRIQKNYEME